MPFQRWMLIAEVSERRNCPIATLRLLCGLVVVTMSLGPAWSCRAADSPPAAGQHTDSWQDPSLHSVQFVAVDDGVQLEVLDWGGRGRPVVLLTGAGLTAHVYDDRAQTH